MLRGYSLDRVPEHCVGAFDSAGDKSFFGLLGWYELVARNGLPAGHKTFVLWDDELKCGMVCGHPPRRTQLQSCTNMYTYEYGVVGDCENGFAVRSLAGAIARSRDFHGVVRFEGLDAASSGFSSLMDGFRSEGLLVHPYPGWGVRFEPTAGVSFEEYLSRRPSILLNTWQRKLAKLHRTQKATIQTRVQLHDPEEFVSKYESVSARSWKAQEPFPVFIPNLIRFAARNGALRCGIVEIDGVTAAAQFWICWAGRASIYKLVYAEEFSEFSPGTILTMEMMRTVITEDQPTEVDFGRGDDAYKKMWLSSRRERWGLEAASPRTFRGLFEAARIHASMIGRYARGLAGNFDTP